MNGREQPVVADGKGPLPNLPPMGVTVGREEQEYRTTDNILCGNVANTAGRIATVGRVVAIVAHHEIMIRRNREDWRVVEWIVGARQLENGMLIAVRQCLHIF